MILPVLINYTSALIVRTYLFFRFQHTATKREQKQVQTNATTFLDIVMLFAFIFRGCILDRFSIDVAQI